MKIFLICSVRNASPGVVAAQEAYVAALERRGHSVYYPPRDTDQTSRGIDICRQNLAAMRGADIIHIFYLPQSQGTHFDMGMAFALGKTISAANQTDCYGPGKSFAKMLWEWETEET